MSETENKKPALSKLAVFSFSLAVLEVIAATILYETYVPELLRVMLVTILFLFPLIIFAIGIIAIIGIKKSKGTLQGMLFSLSAVLISAITIIGLLLLWSPPCVTPPSRVFCQQNLRQLYVAMKFYAEDHNCTFPDPNRWCDLIYDYIEDPKLFTCPNGPAPSELKCHYAMNPDCEPNSPKKTVLLFEAKGGWNQFGGPELLTFDNHKKEGAAIGFNDGNIRFIKPEEIGKLKWKAEDSNSVK